MYYISSASGPVGSSMKKDKTRTQRSRSHRGQTLTRKRSARCSHSAMQQQQGSVDVKSEVRLPSSPQMQLFARGFPALVGRVPRNVVASEGGQGAAKYFTSSSSTT